MSFSTNNTAGGTYTETLHWATNRDGFQSFITIFNYLGWAFPDCITDQTDAEVTIRFFDVTGNELEPFTSQLKTGQSLHVTVGERHPGFEGLIAAKLKPFAEMSRKSANLSSPGRPIATSYFMLYERFETFADFSHELFLLRDAPSENLQEWATVLFFDPDLSPAVIVMNNCLLKNDPRATSDIKIQLLSMEGQPLTETKPVSLKPCASQRLLISEVFPETDYKNLGRATVAIAGTNIEQPMSLHLHKSGDFNLHHF